MPRGRPFLPGNTAARGHGRPERSRKQLEQIRRRIYRIVKRRIYREKDLETVSTNDLLKFLASTMPKEQVGGGVAGVINYISNIPRGEVEKPAIEGKVINADAPAVERESEGMHSDALHTEPRSEVQGAD